MVAKERLRLIKALVVVWIDTFVGGDVHEAEQILISSDVWCPLIAGRSLKRCSKGAFADGQARVTSGRP